jgi:hypothetical protein
MLVDITRLLCGLLIVGFHKPIANFILVHEENLVAMFRQRGLSLPAVPRPATIHNVYFGIGMFVCLFSLVRLWSSTHTF